MREVFGEHGVHHNSAVRAIKPTEVGDAARQPNHDKTPVNKGRHDTTGYPRRGDRCGDRVTAQDFHRRISEQVSGSTTILYGRFALLLTR
jgi:hypothetical protein